MKYNALTMRLINVVLTGDNAKNSVLCAVFVCGNDWKVD